MDIKEMVKGNKQVTFMHYRDGDLWYRHDEGFEFPVPIADVGTATLLASDKALLFMRYIRKHAAMLEHANTEPHAGVPLDGRRPVFQRGDRVRKRSGSQWQGHVVGEYSTALTPEGYAVESETHVGSVQIYPAAALERVP